MATAGQTFENPLTGERMVFRKTAHETNGTLLEIEFFIKPHTGKGLGAHIHPSFDERFEIITGSACYMIGQDEYSAAAGDVVVLPKAIQLGKTACPKTSCKRWWWHRQFNPQHT